jgi:hypothetical protein
MILNISLGLIVGIASLVYWHTVKSWIVMAYAIVGFYIAGIYAFMVFMPAEYWHYDAWAEMWVRPGFTYLLLVMAFDKVAGVIRIWKI